MHFKVQSNKLYGLLLAIVITALDLAHSKTADFEALLVPAFAAFPAPGNACAI